ncbi:hypothetical protein TruAng_008718 [Truncatella angustata]|nr:hypothetical protein TruAng_008718 [Truncatella angustata]
MTPTISAAGAPKRAAGEAGLPELHHPQPKRAKCPFLMDEDEDDAHRRLSAIMELSELPSSPSLPPLPVLAPAAEKSPSPDYRPSTSPLSIIKTSKVITSDQFFEYESQRKKDEQKRQFVEEFILNKIARFKDQNNGKLSLTLFQALQSEVQQSIYGKVPIPSLSKDTHISAENFMKGAATTTDNLMKDVATSTEHAATMDKTTQTEKPVAPVLSISSAMVNAATETNDNGTIAAVKFTYCDSGAQTTPVPAPPPTKLEWVDIYNKELSTIRLKNPFVTGKGVITVKTMLRPAAKPSTYIKPHPFSRRTCTSASSSHRPSSTSVAPTRKPSASAPSQVISLDDSEEDDRAQTTNKSHGVGGGFVSTLQSSTVQPPPPNAKYPTSPGPMLLSAAEVNIMNDSDDETPSQITKSGHQVGGSSDPMRELFISQPQATMFQSATPALQTSSVSEQSRKVDGIVLDSEPMHIDVEESDATTSIRIIDPSSYRVGGADQVPGTHLQQQQNGPGHKGHKGHDRSSYGSASTQSTVQSPVFDVQQDTSSPIQPPNRSTFYGFSGLDNPRQIQQELRFQNVEFNDGYLPSPQAGLRLFYDDFLYEGARVTLDDDAAIAENWCSNPSAYEIAKGYPLVEAVEFVIHKNRARPDGDCYWRSISFCLHGTDKHWNIVKAEHLAYVHHVLEHPHHARYGLYSDLLNKKFFRTNSSTADGQGTMPGFRANMYQVLFLAHAWTPALMQQVTADLYNICVIMFTRERTGQQEWTISETAVRGSHNARHIFIQFVDGNHFQPMVPNHYTASEFRYPYVTVDKTAKYSNAPKATSTKTSLQHPWRNDFTKEVPPPVPRLHGCNTKELSNWLGSS